MINTLLLTPWGRVTHVCVNKLTIIGSDHGLSPGRHQAIIWTNAGILLIGPLGTNFSEILIGIQTFSFKKMHLKMSSGKWRPFCLGLNCRQGLTDKYYPIIPEHIRWRHAVGTLSALLIFCEGNHRSSVDSPHKGASNEEIRCLLLV